MSWRSIPILCYHNIDGSGDLRGSLGHPLEYFEKHLDTIQDLGFKTISAQHLLDICAGRKKLDGKYLVLTFDDCHLSQWLYAVPSLARRGMTGVFFITTDFIPEGPRRTLDQSPVLLEASDAFKLALRNQDYSQFMNAAELQALVQDYGMEVSAHTAAHQACFKNLKPIGNFTEAAHWTTWGIYPHADPTYPVFERGSAYAYNGFWPHFDEADRLIFKLRSDAERYEFCLQDFRRCMDRIRQINGFARQLLCWPWGQFDKLSRQALQEAGFAGAFTQERSRTGPGADPFRLNRVLVGRTHNHRWLRNRLFMYASAPGAYIFFKYYRKKPEIRRVLYLTDSMKVSGGNRQLLNNVEAMQQYGISTYAVSPPDSEITAALNGSGARVIPWIQTGKNLRSARFLRRVVREHCIDVVHVFHSKPTKKAILAKLLGGGFRLYINRGVIYNPNPLIGLFAILGDGVICNSHKCAQKLRSYLTPRSRISVVYNSLREQTPEKTRDDSGPLRIIYIGNANPVKGYDVFLLAAQAYFQQYPASDVQFVSYGIGKEAGLTQFVSPQTLDNIEIHPETPHAEILEALGRADIFVLTSRLESMPNVLFEAFSAALPVVCTDVGGVGELVLDGINGWLCRSEDSSALADRIHHLVLHPEVRLRMGSFNRELAATHLHNARKGFLLLRIYGGERIVETIPFPVA